MGTGKRPRAARALVPLCALALLAAPGLAAGTAHAAPVPPPPSSAPPSVPPSAPPAAPAPGPGAGALEQVHREIEELYRQAGAATDAYHLAEGRAKAQSDRIAEIARLVVAGQERIAVLKDRVGAAARAQYRAGGLPPGARLALSDSPDQFLDGADRLRRGERATSGLLRELDRTQAELERYARDASAHWQSLEADRIAREDAKQRIEEKIEAAEELEDKLAAEEKARLIQLEREAQNRAQTAWLSTGALKDVTGRPTEAGERAVRFATAQLGKPYVWGAEGPGSYDCSGLTSQAWLAAGRTIPRTSQEQLRLLPQVAMEDMRPGDLIIYFDDASHVAMYTGDGAMVHAPRPGRNVTMAGAGSMPIKAVVRPDA